MPANTIAKSSPAPPPGPWRRRAWRAISTASRSWGRPPPEKIGSFCPRTRLFIRSSAVTPVSMKSRGPARATGLIGRPSMRCVCRAAMGGPPSITCPTPLNTRPRIEGETPKVNGSPKKRTTVSANARPDVDSSTSMVMNDSSIAATRPRRVRPSPPRTSTASYRPTSSVRRRNSSGPSSRVAAPSTVSRIAGLVGVNHFGELAIEVRFQRCKARELRIGYLLAHPLERAQRRKMAEKLRMDAGGDCALGEFDELADQSHHQRLPARTADAVDRRERRLPQERIVDEVGAEERELLTRRQRILADDPRHAFQVRLLVEQREKAAAQLPPFAVAVWGPPGR